MLTFISPTDFGEVDLDRYKPDIRDLADGEAYSRDEARQLRAEAKKLAVRLKRHGFKGGKYGSQKIERVIQDKFPKEDEVFWKFPSRSGIEKWITKIPVAKDEPAYSPDAVPRQWRSYVARLSLISEFWHERPLRGHEAEVAQYLGNEFRDPLGEQVDLIPQLAIVRQIAAIERLKPAERNLEEAEAFEAYFKYAPWKLGAGFFLKNLSAEGIGYPVITDFVMIASESEDFKQVSPVYEDALRQLGMPYSYFYVHNEAGIRMTVDSYPTFGDRSKGACSWNSIVDLRRVEPPRPPDPEMPPPDNNVQQSHRGWDKSTKWKQINRISYKEVTKND